MSESIKERPIHKVISAAVSAILAFSIIFCLTVAIQVLTKGYASILGFSVFRVVTGSMEPEIPVGTIIVTRKVSIESIFVDDIICFRSKSPEMLGRTITHRVIGRYYDEADNILLQTKGDFNLSADEDYVTSDNLVGKMIWRSNGENLFSKISKFFSSKLGFLACIALPCLLLASVVMKSSISNMRKDLLKVMESLEDESAKSEGENQTGAASEFDEPEAGSDAGDVVTSEKSDLDEGAKREESFDEMCERLRKEILEELKQNNGGEESKK